MNPLTALLLGLDSTPKRVLVGCESSGVIRDAFRKVGHEAWSCDLLPSASPYHLQVDLLSVLADSWDLMIAHPPCTYLASSGMHRTINGERPGELTDDALKFVARLLHAPIHRICIENPVGAISTHLDLTGFRVQYIQPYNFGEDASKKTGLFLKNLPDLKATKFVKPRTVNGQLRWSNQTDSGQNKLPPSADRWQLRS